jgi:glyoxylase-like metal-dependent hydrolase (beta-lactamase superfamily II)
MMKRKRHLIVALVAGLLALAAAPELAAQTAAPTREITKLSGEVYRFRNAGHFSVFAVTPAGIIVTDPISKDAAEWLKAELKTRFNQPVRYLVYSHDHRDHIAGGEVFADTAIVVAHANAVVPIVGEKRPTALPNVTFTDKMTIELGGTVVELIYTGRNHSDNSIVMRFPRERLLFAVDFIPVESVAFRDFPDSYMPDWIDSLKMVETLDFDVLVPGHGPLGRKDHVRMFREYLEELRAEVTKYVREGKSVDEVKQLVTMTKYQAWAGYKEMGQLNVEGMYRLVQGQRRPN